MEFRDKANVIIERKQSDGMGGFTTTQVIVGEIKVRKAPYRVANGEYIAIPNPISSVKFFTKDILVEEDELFYIEYENKLYKKVALMNYGKCFMVIGELCAN